MWGFSAENLVLVAIPSFVFMGTMMERSGIANDLLRTTQILLRKVPGGLAMSVTVMGTVLAAMTGIIGASVTMMTALALPTMLRNKYSHALSTGVIAASGTLGILIPPSIMLIIMADIMQVSVGNLFMGAVIPGLTLALMYLIFIFVWCSIDSNVAPALKEGDLVYEKGRLPQMILKAFLPPVALIVLIKGSILMGWATPSEAGAVGAFGATLLAVIGNKFTFPMLRSVLHSSGLTISMVFMIILSATCFAYVFRSLGGDYIVEELIEKAGLGSWGLLFLLMGMTFMLGFFLDWVEITLIILPIFAPLVVLLDFGDHVSQLTGLDGRKETLVWFLVLMAINLQTSFLTPPFGFALFYLKGVAPPEVATLSIYRGVIPFVIIQLIGLAIVIYEPEMALWLPRLI
jgi:tripartite ATP-independent transporter DctM subunit